MRLTNKMKENLVHVITCTLTFPQTVKEIEKELDTLMDSIMPKDVKEFYKKYPSLEYRESFFYHISSSMHPEYTFNKSYPVPEKGLLCIDFTKEIFKDDSDTVIKIKQFIHEKYKQYKEWQDARRLLYRTIMQFNTDKQLLDTYPEFAKYFEKAGIATCTKNLPALTGVTTVLKKYGFNEEPDKHTEEEKA